MSREFDTARVCLSIKKPIKSTYMFKKIIITCILFLNSMLLWSQSEGVSIGKGRVAAHEKSILELVSDSKGLLIPRLTTAERDAMFVMEDLSANGLMVYDNQESKFYFWDGSKWNNIGSGEQNLIYGTTLPDVATSEKGDMFFNETSKTLHVHNVTEWVAVNNSGADGDSAYQVWIAAGNTGTEVDYLASLVGVQGIQGLKGDTGAQGIQGLKGDQGVKGDDGAQGIQGVAGSNGTDGDSAYQVWIAAGNSGTEADYLASLVGVQGIQGLKGDTGSQGIQGLKGDTGNQGLKGDDGAQGIQGIQGLQGVAGNDGTNGTNGNSAYQVWIAAGNTGTEADYLASLVGVQGIQGLKGDTGSQGIQGLKGDTGNQGLKGKTPS